MLQCVVLRIRSIRSDRKWWAYFLIYILWTRMKRNQLLLIRSCRWLFKASRCTEPVDHHETNVEDELARVKMVFYREAFTELEKEDIVKPFTPSACKRQLIHYPNYPSLMRHRYFCAAVAAFAQLQCILARDVTKLQDDVLAVEMKGVNSGKRMRRYMFPQVVTFMRSMLCRQLYRKQLWHDRTYCP